MKIPLISGIGRGVIGLFLYLRRIFAFAIAVFSICSQMRHWSKAVRMVVVRQIYFSGLLALPLLGAVSVIFGIAVVAQIQGWLSAIGQTDLLGPVLVTVVFKEVGPILVGFMLIGRSGTAISAELAGMRSRGEIHALESQGVDPVVYLVMPRVLAFTVSFFCLSLFFASLALSAGWLSGVLLEYSQVGFGAFLDAVFFSFGWAGIISFTAKTLAAGGIVGIVCCLEGISTAGLSTEIPQAVTRGVVYSMSALLAVSAIVSLLSWR